MRRIYAVTICNAVMLLSALIPATTALAQTGTWGTSTAPTYTTNGSVGIGTTSPQMTLDINGAFRARGGSEFYCDTCPSDNKRWQVNLQSIGFYIGTWNDARTEEDLGYQIVRNGEDIVGHNWYTLDNTRRMSIISNGNVGIGVEIPQAKLDVNGTINANELKVEGNIIHPGYLSSLGIGANHIWMRPIEGGNLSTGASPYSGYGLMASYLVKAESGGWKGNGSGTASMLELVEGNLTYSTSPVTSGSTPSWSHRLIVNSSGNVGIGVTNPQSKLVVDGTINAKEVKVTQTVAANEFKVSQVGGWADHVFADNYNLAPLEEVESFIKENKHLPDIPSAKEIEKDGLAMADMMAKQMQKIEEMTLYLIEVKKENEALKERVSTLEAGRN